MNEMESSDMESALQRKIRILKQVLMVFLIGVGFMVMSMSAAYPNAAVVDLRQDNSTIFGSALTLESWQEDMMGSIVPAGGLLGTWFGGWLLKTLGRRKTMMIVMVPCTVSWLLVALAVSPAMLLTGRFFNGVFAGMMSITGNVFTVELPDTKIRGSLSMILNIMVSVGYVVTVCLSLGLRWFEIPFVNLGVFTVCFLSVFFLPESPTFLAVGGKEEEAKKVLRRLRGPSSDVEEELQLLKSLNEGKTNQSFFKLFSQPDTVKRLLIMQALFFIQTFSGLNVFMVNNTRIFQDAGSSLDKKISSIIVFFVQMAGNILASLLLDRTGRRTSLVASLIVMSICLHCMGTYVFFAERDTSGGTMRENWGWVPLVCLMVAMFSSSFGIASVPFILNSEYFPTSVRAQAVSIGLTGDAIYGIIALQLYTPLQTALTNPGLYWFFGSIATLGIFFCLVFVEETKKIVVG